MVQTAFKSESFWKCHINFSKRKCTSEKREAWRDIMFFPHCTFWTLSRPMSRGVTTFYMMLQPGPRTVVSNWSSKGPLLLQVFIPTRQEHTCLVGIKTCSHSGPLLDQFEATGLGETLAQHEPSLFPSSKHYQQQSSLKGFIQKYVSHTLKQTHGQRRTHRNWW